MKHEYRIAKASGDGSGGTPTLPVVQGTLVSANANPIYAYTSNFASPSFSSLSLGTQRLVAAQSVAPSTDAIETAEWDGATIYRGWRAFLLTPQFERATFRLASLNGTVWETDTLAATCAKLVNSFYPAVAQHTMAEKPHCSCGIYLYGDKGNAIQSALRDGRSAVVMAECVGWGTVVEMDAGFRVEHCRIEALWPTFGEPELAERLSAIYGVPARNLWSGVTA